jgi:hypothetical protein
MPTFRPRTTVRSGHVYEITGVLQIDFALCRLLKEIGPTAARFTLKIQPLSFQWVVFSSTRPKPATLQKNVAETYALKL